MISTARTILNQLGANKFSAMTGAKNFTHGDFALGFEFPGCRKANRCRITLRADDRYRIEFFKYNARTFECAIVANLENIYAEDLATAFGRETGLAVRL
jgi:hypothetical protein